MFLDRKVGSEMTKFVPAPPLFVPPVVITKVTAEALAQIEALAPGITVSKGLQVMEKYTDAYPLVREINNIDFDRYEVTSSTVMPIGGNDLDNCTGWRFTQRVQPLQAPADNGSEEEPVASEAPAPSAKRRWFSRVK